MWSTLMKRHLFNHLLWSVFQSSLTLHITSYKFSMDLCVHQLFIILKQPVHISVTVFYNLIKLTNHFFIFTIEKETYQPYALVGPTVTRPVQDPLAVLLLDNQLYIYIYIYNLIMFNFLMFVVVNFSVMFTKFRTYSFGHVDSFM